MSETAQLINHVVSSEMLTDEQLRGVLSLSKARYETLKAGTEPGPRTVNIALGLLANKIGYGEGGFSPEAASAVKVGEHLRYNDMDCVVLSVRKSGPNAPYFALMHDEGVVPAISYRFCEPVETSSNGVEPTTKSKK